MAVLRGVALGAVITVFAATGASADGPYGWTGFYAGLNAGYGWSDSKSVSLTGDDPAGNGAGNIFLNIAAANLISAAYRSHSLSPDADGFVGGGQLGYNWQPARHWVAGLEADLQFAGLDGEDSTTGRAVGVDLRLRVEQELKWFGTLRGRLGYLATERLLIFGTGGLAFGRTEVSGNLANITPGSGVAASLSTNITCITGVCLAGSESKTSVGWVAGIGFEWALTSSMTLKAEYLHVDLGDQTVRMVTQAPFSSGNGFIDAKFDNAFDILRAGLNVRF